MKKLKEKVEGKKRGGLTIVLYHREGCLSTPFGLIDKEFSKQESDI